MGNKNTQGNNITYRRISDSDISEAIRLHGQLIPGAGARMGAPYLRRLYTTLLLYPSVHLVVGAYESGLLVGILCATDNVGETQRLLNRLLIPLIPAVLLGLIRNRYTLGELLSHARVGSKVKRLSGTSAAYILCLAVDPRAQRQGIATRLIKHVREQWRTKTILVDTQMSNVVAQRFYKKTGFVPLLTVADSIIFRWLPA